MGKRTGKGSLDALLHALLDELLGRLLVASLRRTMGLGWGSESEGGGVGMGGSRSGRRGGSGGARGLGEEGLETLGRIEVGIIHISWL